MEIIDERFVKPQHLMFNPPASYNGVDVTHATLLLDSMVNITTEGLCAYAVKLRLADGKEITVPGEQYLIHGGAGSEV